jgi:shikimate dehydrogenase
MHNAALQALQLNWSYLALPCASENLKEVLQGLRAVNCRGLNVTIPHKQDVAELCQELSPLAKRLGAVNTLIPLDSGGWHGTNTDVEGFLTPLGEQSSWQNCHGAIIGCGGSARAIAAGLQSLRLASITVIGRRQEALDAFHCRSSTQRRTTHRVSSVLPRPCFAHEAGRFSGEHHPRRHGTTWGCSSFPPW